MTTEERRCPWCNGNRVDQETVDVGVGSVPCEPAHCVDCGAHEIDWRHFTGLDGDEYYTGYIYDPVPTKEEQDKGWMKGGRETSRV